MTLLSVAPFKENVLFFMWWKITDVVNNAIFFCPRCHVDVVPLAAEILQEISGP